MENSVRDFSGLVVDTGNVYIPGFPPKQVSNPCHLEGVLQGIYYSGEDIGSRWRFQISINGQPWDSGPRNLNWGTSLSIGEKIYDEDLENGCGLTTMFTIYIRAREIDGLFLDDIGERLGVTALECTRERNSQRVLIWVTVPEVMLWWRFWKKVKKTAVLLFVFQLSAQCKT